MTGEYKHPVDPLKLSRAELDSLGDADNAYYIARHNWYAEAKDPRRGGKQIPPKGGDWLTLIFRSGRGFGKTRSQVQWLWDLCWTYPGIIGHAVAPTISDMHGTLMTGQTGFKAVIPSVCLLGGSWDYAFIKSDATVRLANGSIIRGFGATDGGSKLRGPQCHAAIGDELREWDKPAGMLKEAFSNMEFGVRLPLPDGTPSRIVCGTTPKNIPYLKNLYREPHTVVVTGSSYENIHNLDAAFKTRLLAKEGTQIGRVEIHGEDVGDEENAIYRKSWIRLWPPFKPLPEFTYILMSLDTAMEEEDRHYDKAKRETKVDYSACSVLGVFNMMQAFTEPERKRLNVKTKYGALLCDFWMERLGFPDLLEKTRKAYRMKYGARGKARSPDLVLIENKASGISLRQMLIKFGVPTAPFDPMGQSKTMRGHVSSPYVKQGMLWLPESMREDRKGEVRDWCEELMDQLTGFAGEGTIEFDDGFDSIVQALLHLSRQEFFDVTPQDSRYPDLEEKKQDEEREAKRIAAKEKRRGYNPYAV